MNWPGYPVLADIRELMMTLGWALRPATNAEAAEEFSKRVRALRDRWESPGLAPVLRSAAPHTRAALSGREPQPVFRGLLV